MAIFKLLPATPSLQLQAPYSNRNLFPGSTDLHTHKSILLETSFKARTAEGGEGRTELTVSPFPTEGWKALINHPAPKTEDSDRTAEMRGAEEEYFVTDVV